MDGQAVCKLKHRNGWFCACFFKGNSIMNHGSTRHLETLRVNIMSSLEQNNLKKGVVNLFPDKIIRFIMIQMTRLILPTIAMQSNNNDNTTTTTTPVHGHSSLDMRGLFNSSVQNARLMKCSAYIMTNMKEELILRIYCVRSEQKKQIKIFQKD